MLHQMKFKVNFCSIIKECVASLPFYDPMDLLETYKICVYNFFKFYSLF